MFLGSLHVWGNHGESASKAGLFKDTAGFVSTCKAKNSTPTCKGINKEWRGLEKNENAKKLLRRGWKMFSKIAQNHQKLGQNRTK